MFGTLLFIFIGAAHAQQPQGSIEVLNRIQQARDSILQDEKNQREALSHLFSINQQVKEMARKQEQLNQKMLNQEANVRALAQEVQGLDQRADMQKENLNKRLRQLYQERGQDEFRWLFMAQSPVELEKNHRYLKLMVDSDHRQLRQYVTDIRHLKRKRGELKAMVAKLAGLKSDANAQEKLLAQQMSEKSRLLGEMRKMKDMKITELKDLRDKGGDATQALEVAFFERKGALKPPVDVALTREYGTYVDPQFRFRLTHKGLFYSSVKPADVRAVFNGRVVFANRLPGFGRTVILDHGDNYYSVYAFNDQLKVKEGGTVNEGDLLAVSGGPSPLFGPGLYFEIRHFTDAIDPRPWIKESVIKTANF